MRALPKNVIVNESVSSIAAQAFFAPSNSDAIDILMEDHARCMADIKAIHEFMKSDQMLRAVGWYFDALKESYQRFPPEPKDVFDQGKAIKTLDAAFWNKSLRLTDVLDYMPDARRTEWLKQIEEHKTPEFTESNVRATLSSMMAQRMDFLSEMVDGIFRGLSGEHVTNRPEGFWKRMIIANVYGYGGWVDSMHGLIQDMRTIMAKFMGRDQPHYSATRQMLDHVRKDTGTWHDVDGGAFRIRVYMKGTAHIEVHPDMAWRLNQILAHRYPVAIPSQYRKAPPKTRKVKDVELVKNMVPFAVINAITTHNFNRHTYSFHSYSAWEDLDKHVKDKACKVLEAIGGVKESWGYQLDYDAHGVLMYIASTGMIPDHKSFQHYPTTENVAAAAIELAEIDHKIHRCLEPSAGQGHLAELMPKATVCVEVSELHCKVLEAKGFKVECTDFLKWNKSGGARFDRIVMNPPFSEGRALAHVEHAASMLTNKGRLVSILPASFKNKAGILPGMKVTWSEVYENEFVGTSVSVVILTAEKN